MRSFWWVVLGGILFVLLSREEPELTRQLWRATRELAAAWADVLRAIVALDKAINMWLWRSFTGPWEVVLGAMKLAWSLLAFLGFEGLRSISRFVKRYL